MSRPLLPPPRAILLATDLGPRCDRAFARAVRLARRWEARLVIASVVPPPASELERDLLTPPAWARCESARDRAVRELRRELTEAQADADIVVTESTGDAGPALRDIAQAHACGLIVTGPVGTGLAASALQRGTVHWLARKAPQALLVVSSRVHHPYRHLALGIDFSTESQAAAHAAIAWFGDEASHVAAVHGVQPPARGGLAGSHEVAPGPEDPDGPDAEALRAALAALALPPRLRDAAAAIVERIEPARLLREYARSGDADLVAIGRKGRGALADVLLGSVAERLLAAPPTDLLLVGAAAPPLTRAVDGTSPR